MRMVTGGALAAILVLGTPALADDLMKEAQGLCHVVGVQSRCECSGQQASCGGGCPGPSAE